MKLAVAWLASVLVVGFGSYWYGLSDNVQSYQKGRKDALSTNPVSYDLEITCAALWVGEQNKKWFEKNKSMTPHAKPTIFVSVKDGAEARTLKQSGYVLNAIAEKLAFTASAQRDLFDTTDLPNENY